MKNVKLPKIEIQAIPFSTGDTLPEDYNNAQINPSCILAYLGMRGVGNPGASTAAFRKFIANPLLMYWDVYKNFYANRQEGIGAFIHTPNEAIITITNLQRMHAGANTIISASPAIGAFDFVLGDSIRLTYSGTIPNPAQIIIKTQEHGDKTAAELSTGVWTNAGTYIWAPFRQTYWGNTTFNNWRYISATDLGNGIPKLETFDLTNIDDMREKILTTPYFTECVIDSSDAAPYGTVLKVENGRANALGSQEGLGVKTYMSDLNQNWLKTEWLDGTDGINTITAIDTTGGTITMDAINMQKKIYMMMNAIAVSGGTWQDWIEVNYDHEGARMVTTPWFAGGLIKELVFQEVVSNALSAEQPLGTLAGKGSMNTAEKGGNIYIKLDEPSIIMAIGHLTPRLDYSQGNEWFIHLDSPSQIHLPYLDEIGFQEKITEELAWWDTVYIGAGGWVTKSAGKQPAWVNYMSRVNRTYGNFAIESNEMFMTLNRKYKAVQSGGITLIQDLTTYIDPAKYNNIFAETALDAQNFWIQVAFNVTARRKMSAKVMPHF